MPVWALDVAAKLRWDMPPVVRDEHLHTHGCHLRSLVSLVRILCAVSSREVSGLAHPHLALAVQHLPSAFGQPVLSWDRSGSAAEYRRRLEFGVDYD